jgi:hypothetical protein
VLTLRVGSTAEFLVILLQKEPSNKVRFFLIVFFFEECPVATDVVVMDESTMG